MGHSQGANRAMSIQGGMLQIDSLSHKTTDIVLWKLTSNRESQLLVQLHLMSKDKVSLIAVHISIMSEIMGEYNYV